MSKILSQSFIDIDSATPLNLKVKTTYEPPEKFALQINFSLSLVIILNQCALYSSLGNDNVGMDVTKSSLISDSSLYVWAP